MNVPAPLFAAVLTIPPAPMADPSPSPHNSPEDPMATTTDPDRYLDATFRRKARRSATLFGEPAATELRAALDAVDKLALRLERISEGTMCPRCTSPSPELHPALQYEGEVQPCPHPWHERAS